MFSAEFTWAPTVERIESSKKVNNLDTICSQSSSSSESQPEKPKERPRSPRPARLRWPKNRSGKHHVHDFSQDGPVHSQVLKSPLCSPAIKSPESLQALIDPHPGTRIDVADEFVAVSTDDIEALYVTGSEAALGARKQLFIDVDRGESTSSLLGATMHSQRPQTPAVEQTDGPNRKQEAHEHRHVTAWDIFPPQSLKSPPLTRSPKLESPNREVYVDDCASMMSSSTQPSASQASSWSTHRTSSSLGVKMWSQVEAMHIQQPQLRFVDPSLRRFICRVESANRNTVLSRLVESWDDADSAHWTDIALERSLWVLTALRRGLYRKPRDKGLNGELDPSPGEVDTSPVSGKEAPLVDRPPVKGGRNLELACNHVEVLQLSCMQADERFAYIAPALPSSDLLLPRNVSVISVLNMDDLRLPLDDGTVDRIRASSLLSACPITKLAPLLKECHRVLVPGGKIELRLIDPVPNACGPKLLEWLHRNLLLNLGQESRSLRPSLLVPIRVEEAGFEILDSAMARSDSTRLPAAGKGRSSSIERKLGVEVGHWLWEDMWGGFVMVDGDQPAKMWWNVENIIEECLIHRTSIEVKTLFALKPS